MKFTKVVILASALAVSAFSLSSVARANISKIIVLTQADKDAAEKEKLRVVEELKPSIGQYCFVTITPSGCKPVTFDGRLKSVTTALIILEKESNAETNGKTNTPELEFRLPTEYFSAIKINPN